MTDSTHPRRQISDLNWEILAMAREALYAAHPELKGRPIPQETIAEVVGCSKQNIGLMERAAMNKLRARVLAGDIDGLAGDLAERARGVSLPG